MCAGERGIGGQLAFRPYASTRAVEAAIGEQRVYAALVLPPGWPRLLIASASGVSVARVLEDAEVATYPASRSNSMSESSRPAAATSSSKWATEEVPGIGRIAGDRCRSQAIAT